MKAIILAAGRGRRMGNATKSKPKCLLEINGRPIVNYQIEALRSAGIQQIGIVTGYQSSQLAEFGDMTFFNKEWAETNMAYSLTFASDWLHADECLVSYSDIFYDETITRELAESESEIAIAYDPNWQNLWSKRFSNPLDDAETFEISDNKTLLHIGGKPKSIDEIQGQYMGLWKFRPKGWQIFEKILSDVFLRQSKGVHLTKVL